MAQVLCVHMVAVVLAIVSPSWALQQDVGFDLLYKSNEVILRDIPVHFDPALASWIKGTLIHNGPGKFEVNKRNFTHLFDGYAKPVMWRFDGLGQAKFSTNFLQTNSYTRSMQLGDVAPYLLFLAPAPPFNFVKKIEQLIHGLDNVNVNVMKIGNEYLFLTDSWRLYASTMSMLYEVSPIEPSVPLRYALMKKYALSSSHPLPLDSRDPSGPLVNFFVTPVDGGHTIHLCKLMSATKRSFFAEVQVGPVPIMHSFGSTKNYVILFGHPLYLNSIALLKSQSALKSFLWKPRDGSIIYVVNKNSGAVHEFKARSMVMSHHVNAYETPAGKIVADFVTYPDPTPFTMFEMKIFTNATLRNKVSVDGCRIRRFIFDVKVNSSREIKTPNFDSLANRLEMPAINEMYRYRKYCYVYGITMHSGNGSFADFRLVKRNLCTGQDLYWAVPGFYPSEPWFVPQPGGKKEDDGILFCAILDGHRNLTYLGVFDSKTLKEVSRSYVPTHIPFLFHGRFFPVL